jgi:hypothetical protein
LQISCGAARSVQKHGAGVSFRPYSLDQIHATVLGLERRSRCGLENRNLHAFRGCAKSMRLAGLLRCLLESNRFPFDARFGGFESADHPFESRGARPYDRSFSLQGEIAVVIGWPIRAGRAGDPTYPKLLEELRRGAQRFNVLHRWHRRPTDVDNDLYLRLGMVEAGFRRPELELIEDDLRRGLGASSPVIVEVGISDLTVVSYPADDDSLPAGRSRAFQLTDLRLQDESFIADLYD